MTKINKIDLENISVIKKSLKLKDITSVKIKKGEYEIEISSSNNNYSTNIENIPANKKVDEIAKNKKEISSNSDDIIKSPMVGVAYLSSDPSTPPYIKIGQHVKQGDTLLLIEAMKTFNEVKSPISGIVKRIAVLDNQPVEFGDELIIFE